MDECTIEPRPGRSARHCSTAWARPATLTDGQLLERFLTRDDPAASEAAFTALVDRHGAMVLSVCRRVLGDPHDAHDAFQATFLVLVSKAGSIRHRESVGGWLFGIARRVAARARVEAARRRRHLRAAVRERPVPRTTSSSERPTCRARLRPADRRDRPAARAVPLAGGAALFRGTEHRGDRATAGLPRGTVLSRLSRARGRIKERLEQQGVIVPALIPAGDVSDPLAPARAGAGCGWSQTTVRAASSLGLAGAAIESVVPAAVATLSRRRRPHPGALQGPGRGRPVRPGGGGRVDRTGGDAHSRRAPACRSPDRRWRAPLAVRSRRARSRWLMRKPRAIRSSSVERSSTRTASRSPARRSCWLSARGTRVNRNPRRVAASGPDGRFEVAIPPAYVERKSDDLAVFQRPVLVARAPGLGPDWAKIDFDKPADEIALRLRRDDVPIEGRVIGLEGRPIPGLTVSIDYIVEFLPTLLKKNIDNAGRMNAAFWGSGEMQNAFVPGKDGQPKDVRTGSDGRFRLTGVGRDRLVLLWVQGEMIERSLAFVLTTRDRAYKPIRLPAVSTGEQKSRVPASTWRSPQGAYHRGDGPRLRYPKADRRCPDLFLDDPLDDRRPGPVSDARPPKGRESYLRVSVEGQPYINVDKTVAGSPGTGTDPRGNHPEAWCLGRGQGRQSNRWTTRQGRRAVLPASRQPSSQGMPGRRIPQQQHLRRARFPYRCRGPVPRPGVAGRGLLSIRTNEPGFLTAEPLAPQVARNVLHPTAFVHNMQQFQALLPINPPDGERFVIPDIRVALGRKQHLKMTGPDGQPVTGVKLLSLQRPGDRVLASALAPGSELTFIHSDPGKAETIVMLQADRSLAAVVELKGDEPDPIQVDLRPAGTVIGRLVDEEGRPRPNIDLGLTYQLNSHGQSMANLALQALETGPDGRFRIKDLVPGLAYDVQVRKKDEPNFSRRTEGYLHKNWWTVKLGEVQNWGDVQVKSYGP